MTSEPWSMKCQSNKTYARIRLPCQNGEDSGVTFPWSNGQIENLRSWKGLRQLPGNRGWHSLQCSTVFPEAIQTYCGSMSRVTRTWWSPFTFLYHLHGVFRFWYRRLTFEGINVWKRANDGGGGHADRVPTPENITISPRLGPQ